MDRSWLTGLSAAAVVVVVVVVRVGGRPGGFSSNAPNYAQTIRALLVLSLLLSKLVFLHLIQTLFSLLHITSVAPSGFCTMFSSLKDSLHRFLSLLPPEVLF